MAGVKISQLPAVVAPALTDIFPIVQAGVTYKETVTQFNTLLSGTFLPLAGGTMSGDINMSANNIKFNNAQGIKDQNSNPLLIFDTTASAVNYFRLTNSITTSPPLLDVVGSDSSITMNLRSKNGEFWFSDSTGTNAPYIRWFNDSGQKGVGFRAPPALANNVEFTWMSVDGNPNNVMTTDGSGNLSLSSSSGGSSLQVPSTGFTITMLNTYKTLILNPAGTLATGTINLPTAPVDQQQAIVTTSQTVTALTLSGGGNTVLNAPTTLLIGTSFSYQYNTATTTWFRLY